jgi:DNA-binding NtrC family response regulator
MIINYPPMKEGRLLIADDNRGILNALQILLQQEFSSVKALPGPNQLMSELSQGSYDLVLLDMNFKAGLNSGNEGIYWLREIKKKFPDIEVVMITAYGDVELAVRALKEGAADFILKPWKNEKMLATLKAALKLRRSNLEISELKSREALFKNEANRSKPIIIGKSEAMKEVMNMVNKVACTSANVLITGENGTGKELIAREIHRLSPRSAELFVLVDLSSITETLFESELFGHKKGSFTNAMEDKTGRIALANRGTLFLDEIGNIPMSMQSKLLTVLQTRIITPVGSNNEIPVDIRLISATNNNLNRMVTQNLFRQDLLYRMNTIEIHLPPLRERPEDIPELVSWFMDVYNKKYSKTLQLNEDVLNLLGKNPWHGNIRELQHTVEKAVILSEGNELGVRDFFPGRKEPDMTDEVETLEDMEKKMILSALRKNRMNQSSAAIQLGITRQTLYNKMKKYDL